MCCECVSTLFVSCDFALKAAVVMGANGGYNRGKQIQRSALDHMGWNALETIALFSLRASANKKQCSIEDINKNCLEEFRKHWTCLDNNNQQLWQCRPAEWKLNDCVFSKLVCQIHPR
jgi:hypothetical protein